MKSYVKIKADLYNEKPILLFRNKVVIEFVRDNFVYTNQVGIRQLL